MDNIDRVTSDPKPRKASLEVYITTPMKDQLKYLGRYIVVHTSGTSGNVGIFVHDMVGWAMYQAGYPARIMNTDQSLLHHNRGAACCAVKLS